MSDLAPQQAPAGWYPDPSNPGVSRYWDGMAWTDHVHGGAIPAAELKAEPGTGWNTPWIWLIILLPIIPALLSLFVPWRDAFNFDYSADDPMAMNRGMLGLYLSPAYLLSVSLGWVIFGLNVFFAYRDYAQLRAMGVPRPFHWAWQFLSPVYAIGRSVVVIRRTGRGAAPLLVVGTTIVLSLVIGGVLVAVVFSDMSDMMIDIVRSSSTSP
ncbi:hypothetical protein FHX48_002486 [Microbacterium halimionae]|uniref:DUF2510 domain-containing protein n=1 Tax=Microbacterium halimionae TaxID=1526413 RepID=A0A7W3JQZ5_9MICO|nr:DUF2510 domain-containing protein [Microbacterium halimionae]MBA8817387.1 hypothetical protein [Microbacterium halimionae]NII96021.1 hypothetical protein [Microbacterium halimionae]